MASLRIAYLCLQATTQGQASYAHVHEIVNGLRECGHEVDLFEPSYAASGERPGALGRLAEFSRVQRRLASVLPTYDALYVRAHALASRASTAGRKAGIPVIQECNGTFEDLYLAWPATRPFRRVFDGMARSQFRWADACVAVTEGLALWLAEETGRNDAVVIPNGANTDVFRPGLPRPQVEPDLPGRYAVFFGALAPWQGIETILAAIEAPGWPSDVSLVVVGDGALRDRVRGAATNHPERVRYLGRLNYDTTAAVVSNAEASLVTMDDAARAKTGLSPLKLYESMACGVPVVAADTPGLAETVRDAGCGIVVPLGDPAALAEAVRVLAGDSESARLMGERGRAAAVSEHSWAARARATAAVIEQAVARKRGGA